MSTYFRDRAQGAGAIAAHARSPRATPAPGFRRAVGYVSVGLDMLAPTSAAPRAPNRSGMATPPRLVPKAPPVRPPVRTTTAPPPASVVHPLRTGSVPPPATTAPPPTRSSSLFDAILSPPAPAPKPSIRSMTIVGTSAGGAAVGAPTFGTTPTIATIAPVTTIMPGTQPGSSTTVTTTTTSGTPKGMTIVGGSGGGGMVGAPKTGPSSMGPIDHLPDEGFSAETAAAPPGGARLWLVLGLGSAAAYALYRLTKRRSS